MEDSSLKTKVSKIPKISLKKLKCQSATEQIAGDTQGIRNAAQHTRNICATYAERKKEQAIGYWFSPWSQNEINREADTIKRQKDSATATH